MYSTGLDGDFEIEDLPQQGHWPPLSSYRDLVRLKAELAVANMRLQSVEQQRDSARRIARTANSLIRLLSKRWFFVGDLRQALESYKDVLAEEAR